ncbi:MAG: FAD-dependent oxidoreductase [Candidatus Solibacter sp.]|nr:FAD-dependent oxidoreductase [Candidatus Solibacter sp.]
MRSETLRQLQSETYDLCVIGGGASGAGCALDAQLRGLRTVLVEAGDFASCTSTASTKMAHGGIRYLQAAVADRDLGQYRLVRHALRERALILQNAPYLARTLQFLVPCFSRTDQLYYAAGLKMYDWIAGRNSLTPSRIVSRKQALGRIPAMKRAGLVGAVSYADGQFDDARFAMALVNTLVRNGGRALNYARVVGFDKARDGRIESAAVGDRLSQRSFAVRARAFVNATGPFSDTVRRLASTNTEPRLSPSKGVHLLFPLDGVWQADSLLVPKTEDGRVVFAIPYQGRLLVGTTDDAAPPEAEMVVTRDEINYLLRQVNPYLDRPLSADRMVSGFAGVRPLVRCGGKSRDTKSLIRDDEVEVDPASGLISILGGKWTTYRLMAQKTIDRVQEQLGAPARECVTAGHRLFGSQGYSAGYWRTMANVHGIPEATAQHLAGKFGMASSEILQLAAGKPDLLLPLVEGAAPLRAEVVYAVRQEMAATLEDVLARRIGLELYDWRLALEAAPATAELMGSELGWSSTEAKRSVRAYIARIGHFLETAGLAAHSLETTSSDLA